jgi:hypothetical protein
MMTRTPKKQPQMERRRLADLLPYPRQKQHFRDLPPHKLKRMAEAARKGSLPPLEVLPRNRAGLPENTILRGHQRKLAHAMNGTTEVQVLVRYDLERADEATVELEFLIDNLDRRHDDVLARARAALRLIELQRTRRGDLSSPEVEEARDQVGQEIGMSGRNLQRYWNVLRTPVEVQDAVSDRRLRLVDAEQVAWLDVADREEIARRIRDGEAPKDVVADFIDTKKSRYAGNVVSLAVHGVMRALRHLDGRLDALTPHGLRNYVADLKKAQQVLAELLARSGPDGAGSLGEA